MARAAGAAAPAALALLMFAFAALVGGLAVSRHLHLASRGFDLGIYDQALWMISRGEAPFSTVRGVHLLGDHFTPVLYPLALLYAAGCGAAGLLAFQAAALAGGAWPLYQLARRDSGSAALGLLAAASYLLYPPLRAVALGDFHPVALATPGLLFALYFAAARNGLGFTVACLWSALCKPEAALVVACLGLRTARRDQDARYLGLTGVALAYFVLAIVLTGRLNGTGASPYVELYAHLGESPAAMLRAVVTQPWVPLGAALNLDNLHYLALLLLPLAFLPLGSPGLLWLAAAPLALNLLSARRGMAGIQEHHTSLLTPVLFAAACATLARLQSRRRTWAAAAWAAGTLLSTLALGVTHQWVALHPAYGPAEAAEARAVLAAIPREASVSASGHLVPHLSQRRAIYQFPNPFVAVCTGPGRRALRDQLHPETALPQPAALARGLSESQIDYIVIGYRVPLPPGDRNRLSLWASPEVVATLGAPEYGLIRDDAGIWVLQRGSPHAAGLRCLGLGPGDPTERFQAVVSQRFAAASR